MDGIRHFGKVQGKQMRFNEQNRLKFEKALEAIEASGGDFEMQITPCSAPVAADQQAYYRSFVRHTLVGCEIFSDWNENRIHKFFASRYLRYNKIEVVGGIEHVVWNVESTANIGKKRMAEFIESVIQWCAEENIIIGTPEDYHSGKYKTIVRK